MTVWRHSISWMRMKDALECPLRLQYGIDKRPPSDPGSNYHMVLGKAVQYLYEHYYNQGAFRHEKVRTEAGIRAVMKRVMESGWFKDQVNQIDFPLGKTEEDFTKDFEHQVINGRLVLEEAKILDKPMKSEHKWISRFRDFGLFAATDFHQLDAGYVDLFDGKGHAQENADPRQLLHYALAINSSGLKVRRGGLLYWRHGYREIDMSPARVKDYIEECIDPVRPIFAKLKEGTKPGEELEARPSKENCFFCRWKSACKQSHYRKPEVTDPVLGHVDLASGSTNP